mmetsp:Transcript_11880/g.24116  ORF Transcript_11880/g.24116 Transcript_11880/m.24116 type:complete len:103 (+) Transcript_11880:94-402(+)
MREESDECVANMRVRATLLPPQVDRRKPNPGMSGLLAAASCHGAAATCGVAHGAKHTLRCALCSAAIHGYEMSATSNDLGGEQRFHLRDLIGKQRLHVATDG